MYEAYFGFQEKPFSLTPDPAYFYRSDSHGNAIDLIRHGLDGRKGVITVSGTSGAGKTTICRTLLEELDRDTFSALVLNPYLSEEDLLRIILQDFGVISRQESGVVRAIDLLRTLHDFLRSLPSLGARALLIVDEAQKLQGPAIAQIARLARLQQNGAPLMQVVLVGQLNLRDVLRREGTGDLDALVAIRYRVRPLAADETAAYVTHRLAIAGAHADLTFTPKALHAIHRASAGNPRVINTLCDRSLLAAYSERTSTIDADVVRETAGRLGLDASTGSVLGWLRRVAAL